MWRRQNRPSHAALGLCVGSSPVRRVMASQCCFGFRNFAGSGKRIRANRGSAGSAYYSLVYFCSSGRLPPTRCAPGLRPPPVQQRLAGENAGFVVRRQSRCDEFAETEKWHNANLVLAVCFAPVVSCARCGRSTESTIRSPSVHNETPHECDNQRCPFALVEWGPDGTGRTQCRLFTPRRLREAFLRGADWDDYEAENSPLAISGGTLVNDTEPHWLAP